MSLCPHCHGKLSSHGCYWVKHRRVFVQRYWCVQCLKTCSRQTASNIKNQKKSHLNSVIVSHLCNGSSIGATARILKISKNTVYRKFLWAAHIARTKPMKVHPTHCLYFDEMFSIEHTKLKPLTIALVISHDYKILAAQVGTSPATGHLSRISLAKYGLRADESLMACQRALRKARLNIKSPALVEIRSDDKTTYKALVENTFEGAKHTTYQSVIHEAPFLKYNKKRFDPLFPINQRCAKLRSDIKRLTRRSWCTTKLKENLQKHLDLYCHFNNDPIQVQ